MVKINPNTAHKVIAQLVAEGVLEVQPGLGTVVADGPTSTAVERGNLLNREVEQLVVEAKKLGLDLDQVHEAISQHWKRFTVKPNSSRKKART